MSWLNTEDYVKENVGKRTIMEPGWYPFELTNFDYVTTRSGDGKRMPCEFTCVDARCAGEVVKHGFNIVNRSDKAVAISKNQIFDIARALNVSLTVDHPSDLLKEFEKFQGQPIDCYVETEKGQGTYVNNLGQEVERMDRNKITDFRAYDPNRKPEPAAERGALTR